MRRTDLMHQDVANLLEQITPKPEVLTLFKTIIADGYEQKQTMRLYEQSAMKKELTDLEQQQQKLLDAIIEEPNTNIKAGLRNRYEKLQLQNASIEHKLSQLEVMPNLKGITSEALAFISNPKGIWHAGDLNQKELVLNLTFGGSLRFKSGEGFKTNEISMPFNILTREEHTQIKNGGR